MPKQKGKGKNKVKDGGKAREEAVCEAVEGTGDRLLTADDICLDTEGGQRHLTEIIAYTTLCSIIRDAIRNIEKERREKVLGKRMDPVRISSNDFDELVVKCEKVMVSYGEGQARKAMKAAVLECLERRKRIKQMMRERKADSYVTKRERYDG
jgi:hypothetical protein